MTVRIRFGTFGEFANFMAEASTGRNQVFGVTSMADGDRAKALIWDLDGLGLDGQVTARCTASLVSAAQRSPKTGCPVTEAPLCPSQERSQKTVCQLFTLPALGNCGPDPKPAFTQRRKSVPGFR